MTKTPAPGGPWRLSPVAAGGLVVVAGVAALSVVAYQAGSAVSAACPAVGYTSSLTVALGDSWPEDVALDVDCPPTAQGCAVIDVVHEDGSVRATIGDPVDHLVVTVSDGDRVLAELPVEPRWRVVEHPHGRRCGGPAAADVVVEMPT